MAGNIQRAPYPPHGSNSNQENAKEKQQTGNHGLLLFPLAFTAKEKDESEEAEKNGHDNSVFLNAEFHTDLPSNVLVGMSDVL
jgi:hypothetical protein